VTGGPVKVVTIEADVGVVVKAVVVGDVLVVVLVVKDVDSLEEESVERVADGFSLASEDWALSVVEDPVDRVLLVRVGVGVVDGDALEVVPSPASPGEVLLLETDGVGAPAPSDEPADELLLPLFPPLPD